MDTAKPISVGKVVLESKKPPLNVATPPNAAQRRTAADAVQSTAVAQSPSAEKLSLKTAPGQLRSLVGVPAYIGALGNPKDPCYLHVSTCRTDNTLSIEVEFSGVWDGRLLRGVIRSIEQKYKMIKHNVTRGLITANAKVRRDADLAASRRVLKKEVGDVSK